MLYQLSYSRVTLIALVPRSGRRVKSGLGWYRRPARAGRVADRTPAGRPPREAAGVAVQCHCYPGPVQPVLYALGILALVLGLAGLVLPVLPGGLLMVAGVALIAWAGHFAVVGWPTVAVCALLGLAMWGVDLLAGLLGARAFGASRWALIGSAVGVVVGLFFGLPGIVIGPALGALAFEYARDPDLPKAARAGVGALVGFLAGSVLKASLAFVMLGALLLALLW